MNKKIYFNNKHILLTESPIQPTGNQLIVNTINAPGDLIQKSVQGFIQQSDGPDLILQCNNVNSFFDELKQQFVYIEAAGGLIQQNNRYLFIYRLDKWDLPKGKIDKGETPKQAALRECEEECAINCLLYTSRCV